MYGFDSRNLDFECFERVCGTNENYIDSVQFWFIRALNAPLFTSDVNKVVELTYKETYI